MVQGGSRSSSEAQLLENEVNRNFLASLLSEVQCQNVNLPPAPERFSEQSFHLSNEKAGYKQWPPTCHSPAFKSRNEVCAWYGGLDLPPGKKIRNAPHSVPPYLGGTGAYWGPISVLWGRNGGPAQNGARPQAGLCQGGRSVGYKSACHVLETARDGSRRRPDSASCSPPLKQATSRSKPRQIQASGAISSALWTPSPFPDGSQVLRLVARLKAGYKWRDSAHFQQPLGSLAREGGSGSQVRDDQRRWK